MNGSRVSQLLLLLLLSTLLCLHHCVCDASGRQLSNFHRSAAAFIRGLHDDGLHDYDDAVDRRAVYGRDTDNTGKGTTDLTTQYCT